MGVGNYCITSVESDVVYVDLEEIYGEYCLESNKYQCQEDTEDYDSTRFAYDDFCSSLTECLTQSFEWVGHLKQSNADGEGVVMYENQQHEISVVEWATYIAVCVSPLQSLDEGDREFNLAAGQLHKVSSRFFDKLSDRYKLRIRTSGWTSGPYEPTNQEALPK